MITRDPGRWIALAEAKAAVATLNGPGGDEDSEARLFVGRGAAEGLAKVALHSRDDGTLILFL
jgi:hypothetical protein